MAFEDRELMAQEADEFVDIMRAVERAETLPELRRRAVDGMYNLHRRIASREANERVAQVVISALRIGVLPTLGLVVLWALERYVA